MTIAAGGGNTFGGVIKNGNISLAMNGTNSVRT